MRYPQIVVMERDGHIAQVMRDRAEQTRWVVRESRQVDACWRLLETAGPAVFVLHLDGAGEAELHLFARIARGLPAVRCVAVGAPGGSPALAGLAWDLGASYVATPPLAPNLLPDVAAALLGPTS